jgi:uncharacterized protein
MEIFDAVWHDWQTLRPVRDDIGLMVDKLRESAEIDIVTAAGGEITDWLKYHGIKYDDLIKTKYPKKPELDYDIFIEDSPLDAMKIGELKKTCLLYDQPWNQPDGGMNNFDRHDTIYRIQRLEEAIAFIKR